MKAFINRSVGNRMDNDPQDVVRVKGALARLGAFSDDGAEGIITRSLDSAIRNFQRSEGLRIDGIMKPGGETEQAIRRVLRSMPPVPPEKPKWIGAPVVNLAADRERVILEDLPARFEIKSNPDARKNLNSLDHIWHKEKNATQIVNQNAALIERHAKEEGIESDLLRAIMFAENARGHKIILNKLADDLRWSNSPLPMNIDKSRWARLFGSEPEDLYDVQKNIRTSARLIRRIQDRIENPTPSKIASVWHYTGKEKTDEFGEYVENLYWRKPWKKVK